MPSVNYYQNTAPFWDFIASMEQQGANHPFFAGNQNNRPGEDEDTNRERTNEQSHPWGSDNPWEGGFPFGGPFAHRGRHPWGHGPPHHHGQGRGRGRGHHSPPPPPEHEGPTPPEKEHDPEEGSSEPRGPPPPFTEKPDHPHHRSGSHHRGGGGRCGARGRGNRHGNWGGRGGTFSGRHNRNSDTANNPFAQIADLFQSQLFGSPNDTTAENETSFTPEVDVFSTPTSYILHISLPGAKKEDIGVSWDAEHSELSIGGVIYRPGDEELLKTLAQDERKVGPFERKVRLGSRANPAAVDADGISAKMEDGILRVEVPKLDDGFVEIKKVDIE